MTETELKAIFTQHLRNYLNKCGQFLYSGIDTLKRGDFYFVGFNPAKDGSNPKLADVRFDRLDWSAYTQQCWYCNLSIGCGLTTDCGRAVRKLHQRQVVRIMDELGLRPEETFAANLVFVESRSAIEVCNDAFLLTSCWQVHKEMLATVRPKYIVCLGKGNYRSAFALIRREDQEQTKVIVKSGFKKFVATFDLGDRAPLTAMVIGVRHPSYPMNSSGLADFMGLRKGKAKPQFAS